MSAQSRMVSVYDLAMSGRIKRFYFGRSEFFNFGLWTPDTATQAEACERLVDNLLDRLPNHDGRILDVACGVGGSTRVLMRRYPATAITAINISEKQLERARLVAPGCAFQQMDATRLEFPDASFEAILCVEAAFHFDTREAFLREAFRVLKPGGMLVMSDMLFTPRTVPIVSIVNLPAANLLPDVPAYERAMSGAGFERVVVEDVTEATIRSFSRYIAGWPMLEYRRGRLPLVKSLMLVPLGKMLSYAFGAITSCYMLVAAHKPAT